MPILINEVTTEIEQGVIEPAEREPAQQQLPLSVAEIELARPLERIEARRERLRGD